MTSLEKVSGFGASCAVNGRGGHLILGYQKSESAPAADRAMCWAVECCKVNAG